MKQLLLGVTLLLTTGEVRAQEYIPPPIVAPAPYQPFNYTVDGELSQRGHRKKVIGAVLMGVGSLVWAGADALIFSGFFATPTHLETIRCGNVAVCQTEVHDRDWGMIGGGFALSLAGIAMTVAGIAVYAVGGSQMKRAQHHLRADASGLRLEF